MTVTVVEGKEKQRRYWLPLTVEEIVQTMDQYHVDVSTWGHKSPEDLLEEIRKGESRMSIENGKIYRNTHPIIILATFDRTLPDGELKERLYLHEVYRVKLDEQGEPTGELKPRNPPLPGSLAEKMTSADRSTDEAARRALQEELKIITPIRTNQLEFNGTDTTSISADKVPVYPGIGIHRSTSFYTFTMLPSQFHPNGFIRLSPESKVPQGDFAYSEKDMQSKTLTLWQWSTNRPRQSV